MSGGLSHRRLIAAARRAALAAGVLALAAACASSPPAPVASPPPGAVVVTADHEAFIEQQVVAPAGAPFTLYFENRESEPHNVRLWDASGASVAETEIVGGPTARMVDVAALQPGVYRLTCDVHPDMKSQLVVQ